MSILDKLNITEEMTNNKRLKIMQLLGDEEFNEQVALSLLGGRPEILDSINKMKIRGGRGEQIVWDPLMGLLYDSAQHTEGKKGPSYGSTA
jgi:hypothetical protein